MHRYVHAYTHTYIYTQLIRNLTIRIVTLVYINVGRIPLGNIIFISKLRAFKKRMDKKYINMNINKNV